MTDYKLWIVSQGWNRLSPEELVEKVRRIVSLDLNFTVERVDAPRPPPQIVVKEVTVFRYVCATCGYKSNERGVRTHSAMKHKERVHKIEVTP